MILTVLLITVFLFIMIAITSPMGKKYRYLTPVVTFVTFTGGFIIYGVGYAQVYENDIIPGAIQTAISTLKMFVGVNAYGDIKSAPIITDNNYVLELFWIFHFVAFAITAKTIIESVGRKALQRIKTFLSRRGELAIIYGLNDDSIAFGEELNNDKNFSIVYVDDRVDASYAETCADKISGLLVTDLDAFNPSKSFLKQIGVHKAGRKVVLYALDENELDNVAFVKKINDTLRSARMIRKENVSLTLIANMGMDYGHMFQAGIDDDYGFGSVLVVDRPYLTAETLINKYPPADFIPFDHDKCMAKKDFHAIIIGFGSLGQAVLKHIAMNGSFYGSNLKITVYDPEYKERMGFIKYSEASLFENLSISFEPQNAKGLDFYDKIYNDDTIDYIAVCVKDSYYNSSITTQLHTILNMINSDAKVFQCMDDGVFYYDTTNYIMEKHRVFTRDNLDIIRFDKMAMKLNYIYCHTNSDDKDKKPLDYWISASYTDKMSSRASANFSKSYLKIIGRSKEDVLSKIDKDGKYFIEGEQLENLAKTEHLRWNAFTYTIGYQKMPLETFRLRGEQYKKDVEEKGSSGIKIQKDDKKRLHACLVPWEDLDELSEIFTEYTGKPKDYKQDDRNNVLIFPELLR